MMNRLLPLVAAGALALSAAACGDTNPPAEEGGGDVTLTLLTHDSFVVSDELAGAVSVVGESRSMSRADQRDVLEGGDLLL